jgi:hypothetical protein
MKQNVHNGTYITIRIHKHNKNTQFTKLNRSKQNIQRYKIEPNEYEINSKLHCVHCIKNLNVLFRFHCNNGHASPQQRYVIRTLLIYFPPFTAMRMV